MANKKISELISTTDIKNQDIIPIVQDGATKKIPYSNLKEIAVSPTTPTSNESVWIRKGKNRFNKNTAPILNTYVQTSDNTFVGGYAATRSTYIEIKPNTTYTISKQAGKTFRVATSANIPNNNGSILSTVADHTGTEITITTEANAKYLFINYYNTDNGDTAGEDVIKNSIQIEQNLTATDFEEFIEEKILIKNSAGVFEEYSDVVVCPVKPAQGKVWIKKGENLFDGKMELGSIYDTGELTSATNAVRTVNYVEVMPNTQYTLSNDLGYQNNIIIAYDENYSFVQRISENPFVTPANCKYIKFRSSTGNNENNTNVKYMLNKGSTALPYEPYTEKEIYVKNENGVFEKIINADDIPQETKEVLLGNGTYYKKYGKVVSVYGQSRGGVTLTNDYLELGILPEGARPNRQILGIWTTIGVNTSGLVVIEANGSVKIFGGTTNSAYWGFNITFIVD